MVPNGFVVARDALGPASADYSQLAKPVCTDAEVFCDCNFATAKLGAERVHCLLPIDRRGPTTHERADIEHLMEFGQ